MPPGSAGFTGSGLRTISARRPALCHNGGARNPTATPRAEPSAAVRSRSLAGVSANRPAASLRTSPYTAAADSSRDRASGAAPTRRASWVAVSGPSASSSATLTGPAPRRPGRSSCLPAARRAGGRTRRASRRIKTSPRARGNRDPCPGDPRPRLRRPLLRRLAAQGLAARDFQLGDFPARRSRARPSQTRRGSLRQVGGKAWRNGSGGRSVLKSTRPGAACKWAAGPRTAGSRARSCRLRQAGGLRRCSPRRFSLLGRYARI